MAFKVGDKVVPSDTKKWKDKSQYKIIDRVENKYDWNTYYIKGHPARWYDEELELFEGVEEMKELTFKEVIANIKEGEVWENPKNRIKRIFINKVGNVMFEGDETFSINYSTCVDLDSLYILQRKQYTFEEAFKAYEEGKEIESCEGCRFKLTDKDNTLIIDYAGDEMEYSNKTELFSVKEIRGKWYINELL